MDVQIITPDKSLFQGQADLITVPGTSGSIGILNHHAPLVSSLKKGEIKIVLNEKEEFFKEAIKVRKFDEAAKKVGLKIKDIIHYKDLLKASLK